MRLLRDGIIAHALPSQEKERVLRLLPEVTSRRSRYSYGIAVRCSIEYLDDFDEEKDEVETDAEGRNVTYRMKWYLVKVCHFMSTNQGEASNLTIGRRSTAPFTSQGPLHEIRPEQAPSRMHLLHQIQPRVRTA